MKNDLWLILVIILALTGALLVGCGGEDGRDGVLGKNGVHDPDGVLGDSEAGPQGAAADSADDTIVIENSGAMVTRSYDLTAFDQVEVSMFDVSILQGEEYAVVLEVEENLLDYVSVGVEGTRLMIGLLSGETFNMSNISMRATVTMPELAGLYLEMSSDSTVAGFDGNDDLEIRLDLGSGLKGDVEAGNAHFDVALNSTLSLSGSSPDIVVRATGGSVVDLSEFQVNSATVIAEHSSHIAVDPVDELIAETDSSSSIDR